MTKYIDADNLINELSAACMPIYKKGITGILGDNSSIADAKRLTGEKLVSRFCTNVDQKSM